jgi:hypothetical protein
MPSEHRTERPSPIDFQITADDVIDATRAIAGHRSRAGLAGGASIAAAGLVGAWITREPLVLLLVPFGAVAMMPGMTRRVDRAVAHAQSNWIGTRCIFTFEDRGLRFTQGAVEGIVSWSAVTELRDGDASFVLLQGRAVAATVPKRAFASESDLNRARTWMIAHLGQESRTDV